MSDFIVDPPESSCEPEELGGASLTSAVTYDGLDLSCLGITSGIDMNAVLQALEVSCQNKLSQISVLNVRVTTLENQIAGLQSQTIYTTDVNDLGAYNCISTTGTLDDTLSSIDDAICALQASTGSNRLLQTDFDKYIANTGKPFVYKEELGTGAILSTGVNTATLDNLDGFATADGKTAYVTGAAVTLVSSRDNYIYADSSTGTFIVKDVPLGNPAPAELSSEIILHCLTTDGTGAVTAQLDLRQYNSIDETYFRTNTDVSAFIPEDSITGFHIDLTSVLSYDSVVAITNPADIVHKDYVDNAISLVAPLWTASGVDVYINTGKVGIGTVPDSIADLYVDGSFRYTDGNELDGNVLVCDANGYASWSALSLEIEGQDEGTGLGNFTAINFLGAGVTAVDGGSGVLDVTITGAASTFLDLTDTPASYAGSPNFFLRVNGGVNSVDFVDGSTINLSEFNNDAGFITGYTETDDLADVLGRDNSTGANDILVANTRKIRNTVGASVEFQPGFSGAEADWQVTTDNGSYGANSAWHYINNGDGVSTGAGNQVGVQISGSDAIGLYVFQPTSNFATPAAGNSATIFVADNSTYDTRSGDYNTPVTFISSRNSSAQDGITNTVVVGGNGIYATRNNAAYVENLTFYESGTPAGADIIEGNLTKATLTASRDWALPDASGTIALTSDIVASGNGIFDVANDGGTVPSTFEANLTDSIQFNANNTFINLEDRVFKLEGTITNNRTYIISGSIATQAFTGPSFMLSNTGLTNNDRIDFFLQNKSTGVSSDTQLMFRRQNIGGSSSNYINWLEQDGATQNVIFNSQKNGATTFGNVIVANGDFGIGTSTPTEKLEVIGGVNVNANVSNQLYVSNSSDFVGVGYTTNPSGLSLTKLGVEGRAYVSLSYSANDIALVSHSGGNIARFTNYSAGQDVELVTASAADDVKIKNGATTTLISQGSTSNIGIGTLTPTEKLDVVGNINVNDFYIDNVKHIELGGVAGTTQPFIRFFTTANAFNATVGTNQGVSYGLGDGVNDLAIRNDLGKIFFGANGAGNNMVFNPSNGGLGIGTATPTEKLEVAGNVILSGTRILKFSNLAEVTNYTNGGIEINGGAGTTNLIHFSDTGANKMWIGQSKGTLFSNVAASDDMGLRNDVGDIHFGNNNSKMTLDTSSGNLGIGTLTPTEKLEVVGNTKINGTTDSTTYSVNGTAGANFSGAVTNITVVDGIVTAVS